MFLVFVYILYLLKLPPFHPPWTPVHDRTLNPTIDAADMFAQDKQIWQNLRQLDWINALMDQLKVGLNTGSGFSSPAQQPRARGEWDSLTSHTQVSMVDQVASQVTPKPEDDKEASQVTLKPYEVSYVQSDLIPDSDQDVVSPVLTIPLSEQMYNSKKDSKAFFLLFAISN